MPYSGLAAGGTGTRTGASDGAPVDGAAPAPGAVDGVPIGFGMSWALPVTGGKSVAIMIASTSSTGPLLSIVNSVEVMGQFGRAEVQRLSCLCGQPASFSVHIRSKTSV